jgi:ADP-ribose pyrophosphatase YjhB (NUDIX family)
MDGYYSLVAGHVEENEPASYTCLREAQEEAAMELTIDDIKPACVMYRLLKGETYVDIYFITENYTGTLRNNEPEKCGDLGFFDMDNLPQNTIPYVRVALKNALSGFTYCEYGFDDEINNNFHTKEDFIG